MEPTEATSELKLFIDSLLLRIELLEKQVADLRSKDISDPNSEISRAMNRCFTDSRRRL